MHVSRLLAGVSALLVCALTSCVRPAAPPRPAPAPPLPPPIHEEDLKPVESPKLEIIDLRETPSADGTVVTVAGVLVNRGSGTTREVYVRVEALNAGGAVVLSARAVPSRETITPGATAPFAAQVENRSDVVSYHVEAVSR